MSQRGKRQNLCFSSFFLSRKGFFLVSFFLTEIKEEKKQKGKMFHLKIVKREFRDDINVCISHFRADKAKKKKREKKLSERKEFNYIKKFFFLLLMLLSVQKGKICIISFLCWKVLCLREGKKFTCTAYQMIVKWSSGKCTFIRDECIYISYVKTICGCAFAPIASVKHSERRRERIYSCR